MTELEKALDIIENFSSNSALTIRIADIESQLTSKDIFAVISFLQQEGISENLLDGALKIKEIASQINVFIHALGILVALPKILDKDERISYLSLGAGNTGKEFDLETNKSVAEFKFIQWRGGPEAIRQNNFFIDFFNLAEYKTGKRKCLYVIDKKYPVRFLNGNRALKSILSKNNATATRFFNKYNNKYEVVSQYYRDACNHVEIIDIRDIVTVFQ
jgi:hypothetical protein